MPYIRHIDFCERCLRKDYFICDFCGSLVDGYSNYRFRSEFIYSMHLYFCSLNCQISYSLRHPKDFVNK